MFLIATDLASRMVTSIACGGFLAHIHCTPLWII